ncbi:MAG: hypothetical protein JSR21_07515 [Proteobacteria bacterium]|nr:hypothetical protein [Pseudomonadota bacterium]
MISKQRLSVLAVAAALSGGLAVPAHAQMQAIAPGTVYSLHTTANGRCPALDWHLVVGPDGNTLSGMVAWNNMQSMAHLEGKLGADRSFSTVATEVSGPNVGRTAKVSGQAQNNGWLMVQIEGDGVSCQNIKVPIWQQQGKQ